MDLEDLQAPVPRTSLTHENLHQFLDQLNHDRIPTESRIYDGNHNEIGEVNGHVNFNSFTVVHLGDWVAEFKSLRRRAGKLHVIPALKDRIAAVQAEIEDLDDILDRSKNCVDPDQLEAVKKNLDETLLRADEQIKDAEQRDNENQRQLAESAAFSETIAELRKQQQDLIIFGWMTLSETDLEQKIITYLSGRSEKSVVSDEVLVDLHIDAASWLRVRADMVDMGFPAEVLDARKHSVIASLQKFKGLDSIGSAVHAHPLVQDYDESGDAGISEEASDEDEQDIIKMDTAELPTTHEAITEETKIELLAQLKSSENTTILPDLASQGRTDAVQFLLESGASPDVKDASGKSAIHYAAKLGSELMLQSLIEHEADLNIRDDELLTPIYMAARHNKPRIVKLLLKLNADPVLQNKFGCIPLQAAALFSSLEVVKLLHEADRSSINHETIDNTAPLGQAVSSANYAVASYLLQQGASSESSYPGNRTPLWYACDRGYWRMAELLLKYQANLESKDSFHNTPLMHAALKGRTKVVKILIDKGAKMNLLSYYNESILHLAVMGGSLDTVRLLVEKKIAIDAKMNGQYTALSLACFNGRTQIVRYLISRGANISARNSSGMTPLMRATWRGYQPIVDHLLQYGANVMDADDHLWTALHMAAHRNHVSVIKRLIVQEADIEAQTSEDLTPLHLAAGQDHLEATQELLNNGADPNTVDNWGRKPLDLAVQKGAKSVINLLEGKTKQISELAAPDLKTTTTSPERGASTLGGMTTNFVHRTAPRRPDNIVLKKAIYDFYAEHKDELSFRQGQILMIIQETEQMTEHGWCRARIKGKKSTGLVPIEFLEPMVT